MSQLRDAGSPQLSNMLNQGHKNLCFWEITYLHKVTPTPNGQQRWAPPWSGFSPHGDTCLRNVMIYMLQLWHHCPCALPFLCGHVCALTSMPAGAPWAEAEEEAAGAPDGPVQCGRKVPSSASQTERGTGSAGGILPQQQQQHHLSWWAAGLTELVGVVCRSLRQVWPRLMAAFDRINPNTRQWGEYLCLPTGSRALGQFTPGVMGGSVCCPAPFISNLLDQTAAAISSPLERLSFWAEGQKNCHGLGNAQKIFLPKMLSQNLFI